MKVPPRSATVISSALTHLIFVVEIFVATISGEDNLLATERLFFTDNVPLASSIILLV